MATPDSYRSICEKFNVGKATALRAMRRVSKTIAKLSPLFITWLESNRAENVTKGFFTTSAFPKVLSAIDGTHINITASHISPETYINRKEHHSIQLQVIYDHERRFIHCYAGNVGSVHDQRVFRLSEVYNYLEDLEKFPNNSQLVGDATYTLHECLLTPYRDNGHLTNRQKNYNFCHSSARMVIKRTFGQTY
ncbi:putative nuclease HARBI1 [Solenopsis invicta]|uniref:putative nuclease HARBI1 n=1 Tax=Solenopsis invicta TaxID=13686 RepID=UPI000E33E6AF|nr:putative nuclease HARBI1 [Solenopsis invicta]